MQGDVVSQSTDQDHLESGQLGTADVTASTVANIGPGIDFYFGFGVIAVTAGVAAPLTILAAATALLVTVGYTVAIASVFTMSGGLVAMTFSQFTSWHPWWGHSLSSALALVAAAAAIGCLVVHRNPHAGASEGAEA
jgi:amino acid transporter